MRDLAERPFDIGVMLRSIERAVRPYPKAAMFELAERGFGTVFQQLVGCIISIRTRDETSLPLSLELLSRAPTPEAMATLSERELDELIAESSFHEAKTKQILAISRETVQRHGGELPADYDVLTSFSGVGPKCANLVLGVATGDAGISVDVHVHRVTNRWGVVQASSPERTMIALEKVIPKSHWIDLNRLLVPFGKYICTGVLPKCSLCPVLSYCRRVGVASHR